MEVHLPEHPIHTWKDFWIHLGTITAGLLIAISLEQSVEKVHHIYQRNELEAELHEEAVRNQAIMKLDLKVLADNREWTHALRNNVDALLEARGKGKRGKAVTAKLPLRNNSQMIMPSEAVWVTAKDSSLLALLPRSEAEMYEDVYLQHDFLRNVIDRAFAEDDNMLNFENKVAFEQVSQAPDKIAVALDLTKLSSEQLQQYSTLLTHELTQGSQMIDFMKYYADENNALLSGAETEEELHQRMVEMAQPATVQAGH